MAADLKGKVALVTGATSGIGFETADYLAGERGEEGIEMVGACDRRDGRAAGAPLAGGPANGASAAATRELCNTPPPRLQQQQQPAAGRHLAQPPLPPSPSAQSNQIKSNSARRRRHPRRAQRRGGPEDRQGDHVSAQIQIQITADCADLQMMADRACRGRWHPPCCRCIPSFCCRVPFPPLTPPLLSPPLLPHTTHTRQGRAPRLQGRGRPVARPHEPGERQEVRGGDREARRAAQHPGAGGRGGGGAG